jgi:hypothetical protein
MLNIGVTGHRYFDEAGKLQAGIDQALLQIEHTYPKNTWMVLSSLADGADQLVVDRVLKFKPDTQLVVPLPMKSDEYINNFLEQESKVGFLRLIQIAAKVIPPKMDWLHTAGYWEAGKYIVDHCDVLVALWDGQTAQGLGGTGDVVNLAIERKKPLVWVHCVNHKPGKQKNKPMPFDQGLLSYLNFPERV